MTYTNRPKARDSQTHQELTKKKAALASHQRRLYRTRARYRLRKISG
jgi:hypothetical protein